MRKRELEQKLAAEQAEYRELQFRLIEREQAIARERRDSVERLERAQIRHERAVADLVARYDQRLDTLLSFITSPEQAALYARARELEVGYEDAPVVKGGGPDDEPTLGQKRNLVMSELARRGISAEEIADAEAST
jgi:hypothetical protein